MKKQTNGYWAALLLGLGILSAPVMAEEIKTEITNTETIDTVELQAAIAAFGVPTEQAAKAAQVSKAMIEEKKVVSTAKANDVAVLPDNFLDMSPY